MAIRNRRGVYSDFDKTKMVDGEFAVVKSGDPDGSGKAVYISFESGTADRLALFEDLEEYGGKIDAITVDGGEELPIVNKTVDIPIPTVDISAAAGDIVEFSTGGDNMPMKAVEVSMSPIQDLNGYDSPWPAGGGKNLFDASLLKDQAGWNIIPLKVKPDTIYTMSTDKPNDDLYLYFKNTNIAGGGSSDVVYAGHPVTVTSTSDGYVYVPQRRASGTDSFQNYHYQIEEGSTKTDYTPYSNICPITGRTGASVVRAGKNIFSKATITSGKYLDANGEIKTSSTFSYSDYIGVIGGKRYWYSGATYGFGSAPRSCFYDKDLNFLSAVRPVLASDYIDVPANATFIRMSIAVNDLSTFQLEQGTEATEYEPYKGTTYPITFTSAGTVYAGTVDLVSGRLVVTHELKNANTLTWRKSGSNLFVYAQLASTTDTSTRTEIWCNIAKYMNVQSAGGNDNIVYWGGVVSSDTNNGNLCIMASAVTSVLADWNTYIANNTVQILYKLATPLTYNLTPTQVMSLLGENVVWSPDGTISNLKYSADISLVVADLYSKLSS